MMYYKLPVEWKGGLELEYVRLKASELQASKRSLGGRLSFPVPAVPFSPVSSKFYERKTHSS